MRRWQRRAKPIAAAERDEEWLRHAVDELAGLSPQPDEEERLAQERQRLQQGERHAEAIAAALGELAPRDRRSAAPAAALRAACRALQRLVTPAQPDATNPAAPALAALERAEEALAEAESFLTRLAHEAEADPRLLEQAEERLFALRAAARKHAVAVAELPALLDTLCARLAALETGTAEVAALEQACAAGARGLCAVRHRAGGGAADGGCSAGSGGGEGTAAAATRQGAVPCGGCRLGGSATGDRQGWTRCSS